MSADPAILDRLDRIEAALAKLVAGAGVRTPEANPAARPLRLTTAQACAQLACKRTTLEGHAARGLCSQVRPKGKGPGKPVYYLPDEIAALAVSEDAARELMARKRLTRRGRAP